VKHWYFQRLSGLSLRAKFVVLAVFSLGCIASVGWLTFATLQDFRHDGPVYGRLGLGSRLIEDVLPPPQYIVESHMLVLEALNEPDRLSAIQRAGDRLATEFRERRAFWERMLLNDRIRNAVSNESNALVTAYFDLRDREFFPRLLAGDRVGAAALARGELEQLYLRHRRVVDEIIVLQRAENKRLEGVAAELVRTGPAKLVAAFVAAFLVLGTAFWVLMKRVIQPLRNMASAAADLGYTGIAHGATGHSDELSLLGASLQHAHEEASKDELTGLLTRRALMRRLHEDIAFAERHPFALSLILIDIDNFKKINDNFGHFVGDQALRHVSRALLASVRTEDVVGRYGGDELVVIARGSDLDQAELLAERLRGCIADAPLTASGHVLPLTVSAGVVSLGCCPLPRTPSGLVAAADRFLYQAKSQGRNRVVSCK